MKRFLCLCMALLVAIGICFSAPVTITANAAEAGTLTSNAIVLKPGVTHTKYWTNSNYDLNCYNKITTPSDGYIYFEIKKPYDSEGEVCSVELWLYKPDGTVAWAGDTYYMISTFSDSYSFFIGVPAGTYYMNIDPSFYIYSDSAPIPTEYFYTFKATDSWEKEPNNSVKQATPLKMNTMCSAIYGDESYDISYLDYFSVYLTAGNQYQLDIWNYTALDNETNMIMEVLDSAGNEISIGRAKESGEIAYWDFKVPSTGYYYIKFRNAGNNQGIEFQIGVYTTITSLATPTAKVGNTAKGIMVKWGAVSNASKYVVYRRQYNASSGAWSGWKAIKSTTATSYVDTTAQLGTNYRYTVRAVTGNVKSKYKSTGTIKFNVAPTVKVANASNGIKVSWSKVANAKGYTVYCSTYNSSTKKWSSWKNRGTAAASKTSWVDKKAKSGGAYKYTVRAVNGSFKSSYNKSGVAMKFLAQPTVKIATATNGVKVSWNKIGGSKGYTVYRAEYNGSSWSGWKNMGTAAASKTAWVDKSAKSGTTYRYTVRAVNGNYKSTYKASAGLNYLATPKVTAVDSDAGVDVSWTSVQGASSYIIYRKTWSEATNWTGWSQIGTVYYGTTYVDKQAPNYTVCKYTVRAISDNAKSAFVESAELYTTPAACNHNYSSATCTEPAVCYNCGAVGEPATGHSYSDGNCVRCGAEDPDYNPGCSHYFLPASCTAPATCQYCGITNGSALGHSYNSGTCTRCGAADPNYTPTCTHSYSSATCTKPKTCQYCGVTSGSALGHSYSGGSCVRCGVSDPNYKPSQSPYQVLKSHLLNKGTLSPDGSYYYISGIYYNKDGTNRYSVLIKYDLEDYEMSISMLSESTEVTDTFVLLPDIKEGSTQDTALLFDPDGSQVYGEGYIYKSSFSGNNPVVYGFACSSGLTSSAQSSLKDLLGISTALTLLYADQLLKDRNVGITIADLGYTNLYY